MAAIEALDKLTPGMPLVFGGNRVVRVPAELAERFSAGDSLLVLPHGELLRVPKTVASLVDACVARALAAFGRLARCSDAAVSRFFQGFAARLDDDAIWEHVVQANEKDLSAARARGRSTTRLAVSPAMRRAMVDGLHTWREAGSRRGELLESVPRSGFQVELRGAALGVVGFVFEGRPNVLADATGVLRGGNAVVFRIGGDALTTASAIMQHALTPALDEAGLPPDAVVLIPSVEHAAAWALFADPRLSLLVARGSGRAVADLGALARQAGVPVSLHGTGGAWIVAAQSARGETLADAVLRSLDRKACNTLNTCCIVHSRAAELVPSFLEGVKRAAERLSQNFKLHVAESAEPFVPNSLFSSEVVIRRAEGDRGEPQAERLPLSELGREWEWEQSPEVSLAIVESVDEAVALFNRYSPRFIASLISDEPAEHQAFFEAVDAPFVGDSLTRWVDGQVALNKPELGLSNWQHGRLFGRGGILSGDTVFSVRTRYVSR